MLTLMEKARDVDTVSIVSNASSRDEKFFITGAKVKGKAKYVDKKADEPGSPTARAA